MKQPRWNWRRVEIAALLAALLITNILVGMLDQWLESKMPTDAWKDIH